jgi:hypothetical protein
VAAGSNVSLALRAGAELPGSGTLGCPPHRATARPTNRQSASPSPRKSRAALSFISFAPLLTIVHTVKAGEGQWIIPDELGQNKMSGQSMFGRSM